VDDVGGITKGIDQNGSHALSLANRSRLSGGLSARSGRTYDITANGSCLKAVLPGVLRRALSSSGENTWQTAWAVFDKRLDCCGRIVARHDRTDHFQCGSVGGDYAFLLPCAKYSLHGVVSV